MTDHLSKETRQAMTQHDMIHPACGNPSRIGHSLHWRDGRVTDMNGKPL